MADDIFKEVDEEMRAERLRAASRRFGALGIALVLLAAIGVGLWQFRASRERRQAEATASTFFAASRLADGGNHAASDAQASALFAQVAARGPDGFRTLARLRQAQIAWQAGDAVRALAFWDAVQGDASADATLRGLAGLLWVQHQMASGDPALLKSRLGALSRPGEPWRPMAQELDAELDLRLGHVADARRKLAALGEDARAPEGVRERATGLNDTIETTKTGG